eukprot:2493238-Amphidinium_carterae.1
MTQHHATKVTKIMKEAGVPQQQINLAFGYFDERAAQHFTNPNIRNLADMNSEGHSTKETRRAIQEAQKIAEGDQTSEATEYEDDYDTSHATTTRATDNEEGESDQRTRKTSYETEDSSELFQRAHQQPPRSATTYGRGRTGILSTLATESTLDMRRNGNMSTLSTEAAC